MVRTYKKKTDRQSWSEESMEQAVKEVNSGKRSYLAATRHMMFQSPH